MQLRCAGSRSDNAAPALSRRAFDDSAPSKPKVLRIVVLAAHDGAKERIAARRVAIALSFEPEHLFFSPTLLNHLGDDFGRYLHRIELADYRGHPHHCRLRSVQQLLDVLEWVASDRAPADHRMLRFDVEEVAEELIGAVPLDLDAVWIVAKPDGLALAMPYKTHRQVFVGFEEPGVADSGAANQSVRR